MCSSTEVAAPEEGNDVRDLYYLFPLPTPVQVEREKIMFSACVHAMELWGGAGFGFILPGALAKSNTNLSCCFCKDSVKCKPTPFLKFFAIPGEFVEWAITTSNLGVSLVDPR